MKHACPGSSSLPSLRKSFQCSRINTLQRQLLLSPFILSLSSFLFYLHNSDSFTFEVRYIGCHCWVPPIHPSPPHPHPHPTRRLLEVNVACYKWVIEVLGELLRMGSDENVHQSHLRLTLAKGCDSHTARDLPSQ